MQPINIAFKQYREALDKIEEAFGLTPEEQQNLRKLAPFEVVRPAREKAHIYNTLRASIYKEAICAVISEISQEIYDALEARYCAEQASAMTAVKLVEAYREARGCTEAEAIQIGQELFEVEAAGRPFERLDVCHFVQI